MRLNAYLARAGVASRRGADQLIKAGRVTVNGQVGQLNDVVSDQDLIKLDGEKISPQHFRYILLNKPAGVITTLRDPQGRRTVADLIRISERVVPVGRLDADTTGALLLTNDGDLAHRLMHPSFMIDKVYQVAVDGTATDEILNKLSNGVMIEGKLTAPATSKRLKDGRIELTIHEGRKHQVKNMLAAVGLSVKQLHRSHYGPLELKGLNPGAWRELSQAELKLIK